MFLGLMAGGLQTANSTVTRSKHCCPDQLEMASSDKTNRVLQRARQACEAPDCPGGLAHTTHRPNPTWQAGAAGCRAVFWVRLQQPAVVREQAVGRAQEGEIRVAGLGHPEAELRLAARLAHKACRLGDDLLQ
jgi:hypothetical protein